MDISDEVLESIHGCFEGYPAMMEDEVRAIVAGVARSAQVAVLRELDAYWITCCKRPGANMPTLLWAALAVREKADALEAGAGQTGAGDGRD